MFGPSLFLTQIKWRSSSFSSAQGHKYAKAGEMDEEEEELLVEQARFGLRMRRRNVPDFGMSPRRFSPRYDIPFNYIAPEQARPDELRREVLTKCVAYAAEDHPDVLSFRDEVLGDSYPLTYEQALRYVDEDGHVREGAPHARRLKDLTETLGADLLVESGRRLLVRVVRVVHPARPYVQCRDQRRAMGTWP